MAWRPLDTIIKLVFSDPRGESKPTQLSPGQSLVHCVLGAKVGQARWAGLSSHQKGELEQLGRDNLTVTVALTGAQVSLGSAQAALEKFDKRFEKDRKNPKLAKHMFEGLRIHQRLSGRVTEKTEELRRAQAAFEDSPVKAAAQRILDAAPPKKKA